MLKGLDKIFRPAIMACTVKNGSSSKRWIFYPTAGKRAIEWS